MYRFFFTLGAILVLATASWAGNNVWTTSGPGGGRIESLAADPSTPGAVYAGGYSAAFKSSNGGDAWSSLNGGDENPLPLGRVSSIEVSPDGRLYAGVWGSGLHWSTDGGNNWFAGNTGLQGETRLTDITVDPDPPHTVYIMASGDVYKSLDGGQSWVHVPGTPPNTVHFTVRRLEMRGGELYAATGVGVYKTSDGGANWYTANGTPPNNLPPGNVREIAASPAGVLYAVTTRDGAYRSDDGGDNWHAANGTPPNEFPFSSRVWNDLTVDQDENLYLASRDGLFLGANGGQAWSTAALPFEELEVQALAFDAVPGGRVLAGTVTAGVARTEDSGATWILVNSGLGGSIVSNVECDPSAPENVYAVEPPARSSDEAASWVDFSQGLPSPDVMDLAMSGASATDAPPRLFAVSPEWEAGLYRCDHDDSGWTPVPFDPVSENDSGLTAVAVDPTDRDRLILGQEGFPAWVSQGDEPGGIYGSPDGGSSWIPLYVPQSPQYPDPDGIDVYRPNDIVIDPLDPRRIYVHSLWVETDYTTWGWHILRSVDGGSTWQEVLSGDDFFEYRNLVLDPNDPANGGTASAVYCHGYSEESNFRSLDGGESWTSIDGGALAVDPELGGVLYLGYAFEVRMSDDRGETWTPLPMDGFDNGVRSIQVAGSSPRVIHAGTFAGIYSIKLISDEDGDGVPEKDDYCPGTVMPESVPYFTLGINRWALVDGDDVFDTVSPPGLGTGLSFTIADTAGCSCEQIIEARGLGVGHRRLGCSTGVMQSWNPTVGDVPPDRNPLTVVQPGDDSSIERAPRRVRSVRERARQRE